MNIIKTNKKRSTYNLSFTKNDLIIICILVAVSIIRILIQMRLPLRITPTEVYDDKLAQDTALHIFHGEYLGSYDYLTLCKHPIYSFILAFCYKFLIPYPLFLSLLNIGSAFVICRAFGDKLPRISRIIIYILLIFSPMTMGNITALRVYRNSILPYLALFIFAGFIALFLRKDSTTKHSFIPWCILLCIALPLFWYTKEDAIWILPFCLTISILAIIWIIINDKRRLSKTIVAFSLPFLSLIITTLVISTINYSYYGIFTTNDKANTEASKLYGNLLLLQDTSEKSSPFIWVSHDILEKVAKVSPTFAPIEEEMNKRSDLTNPDGELDGDIYTWKIRIAMDSLGYYKDAQLANNTYKQINSEIEEALNNGSLKKNNLIHIVGQMRGLTFSEIMGYIPESIINMYQLSKYSNLELKELGSGGDISDITTQEYLLNNNTILVDNTPDYQMSVKSYNEHLESTLNILIRIYQESAIPLDIIAIICFLVYTAIMIYDITKKHLKKINCFIVLCGIILSALIVSFEVVIYMDSFSGLAPKEVHDIFINFYCVSMYPLIDVFKYVAITLGIVSVVSIIKSKRKN